MGDIFVILMNMPSQVRGHVSANKDGTYTIFINSKLSFEEQQRTYLHEMGHIVNNDFDKHDVGEIETNAHSC